MISSLFVCLFVCVFIASLRQNFRTDLHGIFREGWQWANEQKIKFWWLSGSRIRIRIATLVRRALAEVGTVPVLLVVTPFALLDSLQLLHCAVSTAVVVFLGTLFCAASHRFVVETFRMEPLGRSVMHSTEDLL